MADTVALYTFGVFAKRAADPANDGFHARNDAILAAVDRAPGLVARSGYASDPGPQSWGREVYPRFYVERGDGWSPATLSLWTDLEAAMAFAYFGLHAEALRRGAEWFQRGDWPPYALWWTPAEPRPTWADAVARHARLHEIGPSAEAFTFKAPFDARGAPMEIDRERVRALAVDSGAASR